jgi:hypothetical protein
MSRLKCIGCGCTDDRACPGGCHWTSVSPPKCSACIDGGRLSIGRRDKSPATHCPSMPDGKHNMLWLTRRSGVCLACRIEFVASEVA